MNYSTNSSMVTCAKELFVLGVICVAYCSIVVIIGGTPAVVSIYVNAATWNSYNNHENGSQANELIVDDEDEDDNILLLRLFEVSTDSDSKIWHIIELL